MRPAILYRVHVNRRANFGPPPRRAPSGGTAKNALIKTVRTGRTGRQPPEDGLEDRCRGRTPYREKHPSGGPTKNAGQAGNNPQRADTVRPYEDEYKIFIDRIAAICQNRIALN